MPDQAFAGSGSLRNRMLLSAGIPLLCFCLIGGFYLDRTLREYARSGLEERLQNVFYGLLAITDWNPDLGFQVYGSLPDPSLASPAAGIAASVVLENGHLIWKSPAFETLEAELPDAPPRGSAQFLIQDDAERPFAVYAYTVAWEVMPGETQGLSFYVVGDTASYQQRVFRARAGILLSIVLLTLVMLLGQALILNRGLRPLRRFEGELQKLDRGELADLGMEYPREIGRLAAALNGVLASQRKQLERYRNALSDLAHGLKTPLAVLRGELEAGARGDRRLMSQQCDRLGELMEYHLARGQVAGRVLSGERVELGVQAARLRDALQKIHRERNLELELDIAPGLSVGADRQDLMELLGNLMENACKWAASKVHVSAELYEGQVLVRIEDDGPGFGDDTAEKLLARGVRADEAVPGHGLGLAIVHEIVDYLGGSIELGRSAVLGGALVRVCLPD